MTNTTTQFYAPGSINLAKLTYVVIGARFGGQWIFVRHKERLTWEMPAGHIEKSESADQAAVRELFEETGALDSSLVHICDYSVTVDKKDTRDAGRDIGFGRLYGAIVNKLDPSLEYETEERRLSENLPDKLTYPEVQIILFNRVKEHFQL